VRKISACLWCGSKKLDLIAHRKDGVGVLKCQNCRLVMNQEIPKIVAEAYQEEYFNVTQTDFESGYEGKFYLVSPAFFLWQNSFIEEAVKKGANKSFLEIGTATGNLLEILREYQPNLTLSGIDISKYAVNICHLKGLDVTEATIEKYKTSRKQDVIFSSETMEHLENLKSFLEGVKRSLEDDGVFLFYVPSISEQEAEQQRDAYVRFNVNMEHILHFSPEFIKNEFPRFFNSTAIVKEFKTSFGPSIVGAVSKKPDNLKRLDKLFQALEEDTIPKNADDGFVYNVALFAYKFGQFELASRAVRILERHRPEDTSGIALLSGLGHYHDGALDKAGTCFEEYLKKRPESLTALNLLLSNEANLRRAYKKELNEYRPQVENLSAKYLAAAAELNDLKHSKIVGMAIKFRRLVGATLDPVRRFKKKSFKEKVIFLVPPRLRKPLAYLVKMKWRIKYIRVENVQIEAGKPLVSVVIPYYNRADTIDETIESLKRQTYIDFEVIIIDDGSTGRPSIDKLKRLDLSGLQGKVVRQKNQGVAVARNNGIAIAKGRYIVCLDSDDMIDPTYIEKCLIKLESDPNSDLVTTDMRLFGVSNLIYKQGSYNPANLLENNMVSTAAMFKKEAWQDAGGYKSGIGYEDWEYWVNLAEHGRWGVNIPEPIFLYRTALTSRYVEDQISHAKNIKIISRLHPRFKSNIRKISRQKYFNRKYVSKKSMFANLNNPEYYQVSPARPNILILVPWMTFGGAETLIYNYCREIKDNFNLSYATGLESQHEWEYKFKEITPRVYHLFNLYDSSEYYADFVSNFIKSHDISLLHIIHNGFSFQLLPEVKKKYPNLKVAVTMFNDRVEHFEKSVRAQELVDMYISDNNGVAEHYKRRLAKGKEVRIIPNGIDCYKEFNPALFNRLEQRHSLGIEPNDIAVFFIGRLAEEKNPVLFIEVAQRILAARPHNIKFYVIGDGPLKEQVEVKIKQAGEANIHYLGYKADVSSYLAAADIFALPSSIEGFPLSILEAMAMEVAVVASDVGAVAEVINSGDDGIVVKAAAENEFADKIKQLIDHPEQLEAIKAKARQKVEKKYSNTLLGENYTKLYKDLSQ